MEYGFNCRANMTRVVQKLYELNNSSAGGRGFAVDETL